MSVLPHEKQIAEYEKALLQLKEQNSSQPLWSEDEISKLQRKIDGLKKKVYSELSAWDRIQICRHSARPHTIDYLMNICDEYEEIFGDRTFADDKAIIAAFVKIEGQKFVLIGQEKGKDTESRIYRNFGMPHPEGYRKALRAMKIAEKFSLPVITLLDTPGAYAGLAAEERGQGWAIANNLWKMARLEVPIIVLLIGEGCSGGALGMGVGDTIAMLEHAYYSVISPEGCASILWKDSSKKELAASVLKLHAEELLEFGIIDRIIKEPLGGAHHDPKVVYKNVKDFLLQEVEILKALSIEVLLERRYKKFRKMGKYTVTDEIPS